MEKTTLRTLLRSAYVAVLLKNELTETFGEGQKKIFRRYLNRTPISMEFIKDDEFIDLLNYWFEGFLLESLEPYNDEGSAEKTLPFTALWSEIRIAADLPESKQDMVTEWLMQETLDAKINRIYKSNK